MAGHSHWAGIKHKKAINDAKKGKVFTKIAKLIYSAVKEGGGPDPDMNPRLRLVLEKAKAANMPKENIKRAIDKAAGGGEEAYETVIYEGYAPGGVAVMIETLTDNRNRTFPEVRKIMDSRNGSLGQPGCVSYLFQRKGTLAVPASVVDEDTLLELVLEAGAEDLSTQDDLFNVVTPPDELMNVSAVLSEKGIEPQNVEVTMIPDTYVQVQGDDAEKVLALLEDLDDHDDVQNVYANFDIPDEVLAQLRG
jgi:YebC/PmpR family DNA-binding regulatory protein